MSNDEVIKELAKATGLKLGKEYKSDRQAFYKKVVVAADELDDEEWNALSAPAQAWVNAAIEAINEGDPIPDPEDIGDDSGEDDDEDVNAAVEKTARAATGEDEDEEDEDEEDEDEEEEEEEEEDEDDEEDAGQKPSSRVKGGGRRQRAAKKKASTKEKSKMKKAKVKKKAKDPAGGNKKKDAAKPEKKADRGGTTTRGMQGWILQMFAQNPSITVEKVMKALEKKGFDPKEATIRQRISNMRAVYRALEEAGRLKDK